MARELYGGFARYDNLLRMIFLDPLTREFYADWDHAARIAVGLLLLRLRPGRSDSGAEGMVPRLCKSNRGVPVRNRTAEPDAGRSPSGARAVGHVKGAGSRSGIPPVMGAAVGGRGPGPYRTGPCRRLRAAHHPARRAEASPLGGQLSG
ncbi:hypothetical protein [Streptomyces sp. MK37H]|uniref:MmyB family transcriptional regulator n=1 Tax=Streptomyces sp. MK37H TaxID=2699117 RepID=UPI0035A93B2B